MIIKIHQLTRALLAALLLLITSGALASNPSQERADLARFIHELDFLIQQTHVMNKNADANARITFDYPELAAELHLIRRKISIHLQGVLALPNPPTVKGDYSAHHPGAD
ncbi:MAG: RAQPRD family integrative conjugative element protein [Gammaproteobacteria bacterium]|nr:RAQPRD family integrative conjugative element protein [Gammaproteobacteria bacterium]